MKDTVKVFFDPPVLGLPFGIRARIGPKSSVVLKTTYVDERVRIGKGSRGSLFVFTRGYDSDKANMDIVGLEKTTVLGKAILAMSLGGMIASGGLMCHSTWHSSSWWPWSLHDACWNWSFFYLLSGRYYSDRR